MELTFEIDQLSFTRLQAVVYCTARVRVSLPDRADEAENVVLTLNFTAPQSAKEVAESAQSARQLLQPEPLKAHLLALRQAAAALDAAAGG